MTLVELLIALTIFGIVITAAVAFMAQQNTAFQESLVRLNALRNLRYALTALEQDVQTLGTNVPTNQPGLLYGDDDVIVFSADYVTNIAGDPFAVFYDPDAPSGQVAAPGGALTVPTTTATVADSVFEVGGVRSPAEILSFFFRADTLTPRSDDFVLYRQVNDGTPEMVARNLLRRGDTPFFTYQREVADSTGAISFATVGSSDLPLDHASSFHLAAADTGQAAWADSVRAVRVSLASTNGLEGDEERRVDAGRLIHMPNAGAAVLRTCGSSPLLGVALDAAPDTSATGDPVIGLGWLPAIDEAGGEGDVVRYVLWKRDMTQSDWGDPFVAIPA
ncbi:MAG: type II secretion system protein, partial [Gemmatimonadota bacterium]